ncbi:DgyrCDS14356 [Dimorphilus gyrociliatus]|uniref:Guanylate cyclase n=1 Tax=Dimorphilus gyrociliatus TaxID=2664684 RepID=A0A7I8WDB1_9ANNE|nr:DgyrCDS14356 [Dimorphilus gyrociliatus]
MLTHILYVLFLTGELIQLVNGIKVALLLPEEGQDIPTIGSSIGALELAIEKINKSYSFEIEWKDSKCSKGGSISALYELMEQSKYSLIMGPACSEAMKPTAELASYRDIPIFGFFSPSPDLSKKSVFTTLVRLLGPTNYVAVGLRKMLSYIGWSHIFLVSSNAAEYRTLAGSINDIYKASGSIARWIMDVDLNPAENEIDNILVKIKSEARIIILCVPSHQLRKWMLRSVENNMEGGEYVFVYTTTHIPDPFCMKSLMKKEVESFLTKADEAATKSGYLNKFGVQFKKSNSYSLYLHDALLLFATAHQELQNKNQATSGTSLFSIVKNRFYPLKSDNFWSTGDVYISDNGDRQPGFTLFDLKSNGIFEEAVELIPEKLSANITTSVKSLSSIIWGDGTAGLSNKPQDIPDCGFQNENCPNLALYITPPTAIMISCIIGAIAYVLCRRFQREKDLENMTWKIRFDDLKEIKKDLASQNASIISKGSICTNSTLDHSTSPETKVSIKTAEYRGGIVVVKSLRKQRVKIDRDLKIEMRSMTELKSNFLASFIGASTDISNVCAIWEFGTKGSLKDVLENDDIFLDDTFKFSFANDILSGLKYLHTSPLKYHGKLTSKNCIIDGRWLCKLTDYGLEKFKEGEDHNLTTSDLFWIAPEHLDTDFDDSTPPRITGRSPEGDIYSVGIIFKEIFTRTSPFEEYDDLNDNEIIKEIINGNLCPKLEDLEESSSLESQISNLIKQTWQIDNQKRPSSSNLLKNLAIINPHRSKNVVDNMAKMLEKQSEQLEKIVGEKSEQIEAEKKRLIAKELINGKGIQAESFEAVTIYFSDIVKFTNLAAKSSPMQVVDLLNALYTLFDQTISVHDVYKVETIGDAYMLVSGLPRRNGEKHCTEIANCALDLLSGILSFKVPHLPDYKIQIRIGLHSGSAVAGVVGKTMPRYCLFGDTVNTASRMESNGLPLRIHLSKSTFKGLSLFDGYLMAERGGIEVKGKGNMTTYWLIGKIGFMKPLPDFDILIKEDDPRPKRLPPTMANNEKLRKNSVYGASDVIVMKTPVPKKPVLKPIDQTISPL